MIAIANPPTPSPVPAWHAQFLSMLPAITRYASFALRDLQSEARYEAVQEVVANCLVAFCRLRELDKLDVVYPSVLARYGVAQLRSGRQVGGKLNVNDVTSVYARRQKRFFVERLDHFCKIEGRWRESIVEDRRAGPAETAAMRIDFADWLIQLPERRRQIAEALGAGDSARSVAERFSLSPARVSQMRRELRDNWVAFHGEVRDKTGGKLKLAHVRSRALQSRSVE